MCDLTAVFELAQPTVRMISESCGTRASVEAERRGTWAHYRLVPEAIERLQGVFGAGRVSAAAAALPGEPLGGLRSTLLNHSSQ